MTADLATTASLVLVKLGRVGQDRIDVSVRRVLLEKFRLGLFDQRYVDVDAAAAVVGRPDFVEAGLDAQRASYTLLTTTTTSSR